MPEKGLIGTAAYVIFALFMTFKIWGGFKYPFILYPFVAFIPWRNSEERSKFRDEHNALVSLEHQTRKLYGDFNKQDGDEFSKNVALKAIENLLSSGYEKDNLPIDLIAVYSRIISDYYNGLYSKFNPQYINSMINLEEIRQEKKYVDKYYEMYKSANEDVATMSRVFSSALVAFIKSLPKDAGLSVSDRVTLQVRAVDVLDKPKSLLQRFLLVGEWDEGAGTAFSLRPLRKLAHQAIFKASDIDHDPTTYDEFDHTRSWYGAYATKKTKLTLPEDAKGSIDELLKRYLDKSPFKLLFDTKLNFTLPAETRFEHTHIVAGTGHGKTQLLQLLIKEDLERAIEEPLSVIVIDGQGGLINNILHMPYFAPNAPLHDRVVLVDPTDVAHPACLNMFDVDHERLARYGAAEREAIYNGTIELYAYLFGALLGAELTQKQDVVFRYLAELMISIPAATLTTLREAVDNPAQYQSAIDRLDETSRAFFETQLKDASYDDTRKQISRRLWGVIQNKSLARMFNNPENKVDLFKETNAGKIILINTAKDHLKSDGSRIFGRFFIAMAAQAALQRAAIDERSRIDTHVYIDEAHEYIDERVLELLYQARKYRFGLHMAHQDLDQLTPEQRAGFGSSTTIKMAGGVSAKDARALAPDMRVTPEEILNAKKHEAFTEYICFIKNVTGKGVRINVPFGTMERLGRINKSEYDALIARNRERYGASISDRRQYPEGAPPRSPADAGATKPDGFDLGDHETI